MERLVQHTVSFEQISDIVKMAGLVAGGLWAAWTFHKLQRVRAAELENNQKVTAIQKARIEQEELRMRLLRQQPQLAVQLNVAETASPTEICRSVLCISVVLKNEGEQNLQVEFDPAALTVGRIAFGKNGEQAINVHRYGASYFAPDSNEPQMFRERILRAGQKRQMALAVLPITEPAGYLIQFHAVYFRIPFDGEKASHQDPVRIDAVEQAVYFATGRANESASPAPGVAAM